ncbi:MAG: GNAT family N-acetyltransferase [Oscillibacter sp.]|nr:GNAT family N-acetyltransferase [Oscillibacter sp.]
MIQWIEAPEQRAAIARQILEKLPDWFGIPESREAYICESRTQPFWADIEGGAARGFLALKETSPHTAELAVMGVLPQYHRRGIGRALFEAFRQYARTEGYAFLQVKTVREGCYASYNGTNAFYKSLGFRELECFPTLWDEENPCQVYVMAV